MKTATGRFVLFAFLCCVEAGTVTAQDFQKNEPPAVVYNSFSNALGMFGSTAAGNPAGGLQYQHWFDRFGFQITGGGVYNKDGLYNNILDYSVIIDGLWTVYGNSFSNWLSGRLYLWVSAGHHGYIPFKGTYDESMKPIVIEEYDYVPNMIAGFGIGIETIFFEHFSVPFQFGYSAEFPTSPTLGFSVGSGLRYRY